MGARTPEDLRGLVTSAGPGECRVRIGQSKLCQKLRRRPPTLDDATDAEIQRFRRWLTPTDARESLPKQARYNGSF